MTDEVKEVQENIEQEEKKETKEKSENAFTKFWNKTKKSVNDSVLESKIEKAYNEKCTEFVYYGKERILSVNYYGVLENNVLILFGKQEIKPFDVIIDSESKKAYYVVSTAETTVKSTVEEVEYERVGTSVTLDENVEEVNVIKAGNRFFIYKGEE